MTLLELLDRPEVHTGRLDTAWLDRLTATESFVPTRHADIAILAAAIDAYDEEEARERARFFEAAARGRPQARDELGVEVELRLGGRAYRLVVGLSDRDRYRVRVGGIALLVDVEQLGRLHRRLTVGGRSYRVVASAQGTDHLVDVEASPTACRATTVACCVPRPRRSSSRSTSRPTTSSSPAIRSWSSRR